MKKSFTLIELTVSMGILALIVGLTAGALISVVKSYQRQRVISEIERNGDFIIRTLEESLRGATSVSCATLAGVGGIPGTQQTCNLGDSTARRILAIQGTNPRFIGRGSGTNSALCSTSTAVNCFVYAVTDLSDPDTGIDPVARTLRGPDETIITNNSWGANANGVDVEEFNVTINGGTNGIPYNITVTIVISAPVGSLWRSETRSFQTFLTLRGSYD